jgi:hypothetical protein
MLKYLRMTTYGKVFKLSLIKIIVIHAIVIATLFSTIKEGFDFLMSSLFEAKTLSYGWPRHGTMLVSPLVAC